MKLAVMTRNTNLYGLICQCFEADGALCSRFADDVALARAVYREEFSAILVDADTGFNPLRPLLARRECYSDRRAPVVVVGALHDRESIADALDAGADDVVLSPVDTRELVLRVHLALRRFQCTPASQADDAIECGAYRLDRGTCAVQMDDRTIRLTSREFAIVWLLFSRLGEYVSRRQIAGAVWSSPEDVVGRTLEQHIYKLRKKLELNGAHGVHLRTMYAHGYRVERSDAPPDTPAAATLDTSPDMATAATAATNAVTVTTAILDAAVTSAARARHFAERPAVNPHTAGAPALVLHVPPHTEIHTPGSPAVRNARP
ncbi:winged helix-turn-helix domain-containing protein [Paraburkholderia sp.]|uniref:winged helix-turn-helix domain-containing protein n=1 Tax=Paraburkholderia sp. TaxID=1926495 RepID=UPI003D6E7F30